MHDEGLRADRFPPLAQGEGAVLLTGDVLLADGAEATLLHCGDDWSLSELSGLVDSADASAVVINQEGPVTDREEEEGSNRWNYGARPETAIALADAGITHASLANNHMLDRGVEGLVDTIGHLEGAGIEIFGAGLADEAASPAVIEAGGTSVGLVTAMHPWSQYLGWAATDEREGILLIGEASRAALEEASADVVVFYPHWGATYVGVDDVQPVEAAEALNAGAHVIVGHHSHQAQPIGELDGATVLWSLGNTAFGSGGRFEEGQGYGLLARLVVDGGALVRIEVVPVRVNNREVGFRTEPCTIDEAEGVLEGLDEVGLVIEDGVGSLAVGP